MKAPAHRLLHRLSRRLPQRRAMAASAGVMAIVIAVAAGCGLRTSVRPPQATAPIIPGVVSVKHKGPVAVVQWKRADQSADGLPLRDLTAFVVERKLEDQQEWQTLATVSVVDQDKYRRRQDFSWRDETSGNETASYRVLAVCADGQQGPPHEAVRQSDDEVMPVP